MESNLQSASPPASAASRTFSTIALGTRIASPRTVDGDPARSTDWIVHGETFRIDPATRLAAQADLRHVPEDRPRDRRALEVIEGRRSAIVEMERALLSSA